MKKYILIVQENKHFNINWKELNIPSNFILHLLAKPDVVVQMQDNNDISLFAGFDVSDTLSYDDILSFSTRIYNSITEEDSFHICTNEEFMLVNCGKVRQILNLPGDKAETLMLFRDKILMKEYLANTKAKDFLPGFLKFNKEKFLLEGDVYINSVIEKLSLPVFVKPTDAAGSRRTNILYSMQELYAWMFDYSKYDLKEEYEFNELLQGDLYHVDCAVNNSEVVFTAIGQYIHPCHEFLQRKTTGSIHIPRDSETFKQLSRVNKTILEQYSELPNGLYHLELYHDPVKNLTKFVEIAARPAGALIPNMYQYIYHFDIRSLHYELQLGIEARYNEEANNRQYAWLNHPVLDSKQIFTQNTLPNDFHCKVDMTILQPDYHDGVIRSIHDKATQCIIHHPDISYAAIEHDFISIDKFDPFILKNTIYSRANPLTLRVVQFYHNLAINFETITHDAAISANDHSLARGTDAGLAIKSVLLIASHTRKHVTKYSEKNFILVALPGDMSIDFQILKQYLSYKTISIASADDLAQLMECEPGGVAPLPLFSKSIKHKAIPFLVDNRLFTNKEYLYHGHGQLDQSIKIKAIDYQTAIQNCGAEMLNFGVTQFKEQLSIAQKSTLFSAQENTIYVDNNDTQLITKIGMS